jgi:hypothetical protein
VKLFVSAVLLALPSLVGGQAARNPPDGREPLDAYLSCRYGAGLNVVSVLRRQASDPRSRTVATATGERKISVIDGYRLMLSQGEPGYFANMKIEKSDPRQYASDKDAAIKNLEYAMKTAAPGIKPVWDHMPYNGYDVYAVTDTTMGVVGPNGMYLLFRDSAQVIVTIYFLGQKPEHRHFRTIQEHDAIVDKMLEDLTTCANAPPPAAIAGTLRPPRTPEEFDQFVNKYYANPHPERIAGAIVTLTSSGVLQIDAAVLPITSFFSEIFLANPERLPEWTTVIDKQPGLARAVLDSALAWSKAGGVLQLPRSVQLVGDLYWGAFFASGNPAYVKKLVGLAGFASEQNDALTWAAGSMTKFLLARNSRQHALLRSILEDEKRTADKATRDLINEILTTDPQWMQKQMFAFRDRQFRSGKWK